MQTCRLISERYCLNEVFNSEFNNAITLPCWGGCIEHIFFLSGNTGLLFMVLPLCKIL